MCLDNKCFGAQKVHVRMEWMLLVFGNRGVLKSVRRCHRGTAECPSHVTHDAFRTANTDLICVGICFNHLQACLDPEDGDGNLRRNVGNYLPFGTEFIPLDLKSHGNFPQVAETFPAFYPTNQVCCAHNSLPRDTILRPTSPVPNLSVYFCKVHFNIVILLTLKSSKYSHPFKCADKKCCI